MASDMFEKAELSVRDHALYGKLHMSREDIGIARISAAFLQKKGWHSAPFFRRGSTYIQQVAFTTTMIVAYARPFSPGRGNIDLPGRLKQYVTPLKGDLVKSFESMRYAHFTAPELELFMVMTDALCERITDRMEDIRTAELPSTRVAP